MQPRLMFEAFSPTTVSLKVLVGSFAMAMLLGAGPIAAQTALPTLPLQSRIEGAARAMAKEHRMNDAQARQMESLVEFVVGNMLFVAVHEMGHGLIAEMRLPVLGREEDAADSFAIVTGINMGTDMSYRVLAEATKGWFLSDKRDTRDGEPMAYYDEHGLNQQRAYQIVCLMVGADPVRFKELADQTKLPEDRRETCRRDYSTAEFSWDFVLKPHRRSSDQPKIEVKLNYGEGKGDLKIYERTFRDLRFLEMLAENAAEKFVWSPGAIEMEIRSCGEVNAFWSIKNRKLNICYEMARDFAQLYRDFGPDQKSSKRKQKR